MTNQELIEKGIITAAALATNGKLNPKQSDRFLDMIIDESEMKGIARIERFSNEEMNLEKIGIGSRVALPKTEAVDPVVRRSVSTSKTPLKPVEIMVPFEIGDIFKEINIEGSNVEDHILQMFSRRLNNNLEELFWDGNATGPAILESNYVEGGSTTQYRLDGYLGLFDGWLKTAEAGHVVDNANAAITSTTFARALRAMPRKYKRNKNDLRWFVSTNHEAAYRESIAARLTAFGDAAVNGADNPRPFGVQLQPISLLSEEPQYVENSVANTDGTTATALSYAPISNLILTPSTLGATPVTPYVLGVDYTQSLPAGTWTRLGTGGIGSGATVKATYLSAGKFLLTPPKNCIIAIGRDIRLERQRDIFKGTDMFALTVKAYATFEETDAVVLVKNVAVPA
jgi:hypothetical protein